MLSDVRRIFDESVDTLFKDKPHLIPFFKDHERKNVVLNNLCEQILIIENRNLHFNAENYRSTIKDIALLFCKAALKHTEELNLSSAERNRRDREQNILKIAQETIKELQKDGVVKGIVEDKVEDNQDRQNFGL
jgi:hypothetical protein